MEECPVINCGKNFQTKYSLSNHLRRTLSADHKEYYVNNIKKKICSKCGKGIDKRSKHQDVCYTCLSAGVKKDIKKELRHTTCFKCKENVSGYFSKMNTRVMCEKCQANMHNKEIEYKKLYDLNRYARKKLERKVAKNKRDIALTERLEALLKDDLIEGTIPLHVLCDKYNISLKYIKIAAKKVMSEQEYIERNFNCRQRAGIIQGEKHKERWKKRKRPKSPIFSKEPNKLEKFFGDQIQEIDKNITIRYNVWKTLKDTAKNVYMHLQTDIVISINNHSICLLCDGQAFHGSNCYFRGDTVKEDEYKSEILFKYNPFVLRYSESEIKNGQAIKHLKSTLEDILLGKISKLYRSWMI
jgi:hypothetical protein